MAALSWRAKSLISFMSVVSILVLATTSPWDKFWLVVLVVCCTLIGIDILFVSPPEFDMDPFYSNWEGCSPQRRVVPVRALRPSGCVGDLVAGHEQLVRLVLHLERAVLELGPLLLLRPRDLPLVAVLEELEARGRLAHPVRSAHHEVLLVDVGHVPVDRLPPVGQAEVAALVDAGPDNAVVGEALQRLLRVSLGRDDVLPLVLVVDSGAPAAAVLRRLRRQQREVRLGEVVELPNLLNVLVVELPVLLLLHVMQHRVRAPEGPLTVYAGVLVVDLVVQVTQQRLGVREVLLLRHEKRRVAGDAFVGLLRRRRRGLGGGLEEAKPRNGFRRHGAATFRASPAPAAATQAAVVRAANSTRTLYMLWWLLTLALTALRCRSYRVATRLGERPPGPLRRGLASSPWHVGAARSGPACPQPSPLKAAEFKGSVVVVDDSNVGRYVEPVPTLLSSRTSAERRPHNQCRLRRLRPRIRPRLLQLGATAEQRAHAPGGRANSQHRRLPGVPRVQDRPPARRSLRGAQRPPRPEGIPRRPVRHAPSAPALWRAQPKLRRPPGRLPGARAAALQPQERGGARAGPPAEQEAPVLQLGGPDSLRGAAPVRRHRRLGDSRGLSTAEAALHSEAAGQLRRRRAGGRR
ncbi:3'-5' exonuclease domain containing protein, putative [Babesia caballi]|uniref:3'-5' exonuclease domain containing protein, putative n=1 Tax=Babesia caballi TaxID=5871 RepID=A0AAV4LTP3_BABCB|nr:3'-5' exonuclease domain containing protein, putative [Babesia caballi]